MKAWNNFPMVEPRRVDIRTFVEREREDIEQVIAGQVSMLLADYAVATCVDIDNSDCDEVDGSKSYYILEATPYFLTDGGRVHIRQAPQINGYTDTSEGLHSVIRTDYDDYPILELGIWDPEMECDHRIIDGNGEKPSIETLQELYEALIVCTYVTAHTCDPNVNQYDTTQFPLPVIEPDLQNIVERFLD